MRQARSFRRRLLDALPNRLGTGVAGAPLLLCRTGLALRIRSAVLTRRAFATALLLARLDRWRRARCRVLRRGGPNLLRWPIRRLAGGLTRPRLRHGLTRPRLKIGIRMQRRIGMELAAAGCPVGLQVVRDPFGRAMPMTVPVVVTPLAAEQDQRHGDPAIKKRRRAVVVAVAGISGGVGIVRRRWVSARWISGGRISRLRIPGRRIAAWWIPGWRVSLARGRGRNVATAQRQQQGDQPKSATHRSRVHCGYDIKNWASPPGKTRRATRSAPHVMPGPAQRCRCRSRSSPPGHTPRRIPSTGQARLCCPSPRSARWRPAA
jgi:hypothetical protein